MDLQIADQTGHSLSRIGDFVYEQRAPSLEEVNILVMDMERALVERELLPIENDFIHYIDRGYYFRALYMPAGTIAIGKIHTLAHTCFVAQGRVSIYSTIDGVAHLKKGDVFPASANSQKIAITMEDTIFVTVTPCKTTNLDLIEMEILECLG